MRYFFALGNNPALSLAELSAVFSLGKKNTPAKIVFFSSQILILEPGQEIAPQELIAKLGGVIKIGKISSQVGVKNLAPEIKKNLSAKNIQGKFNFGFSCYGKSKVDLRILGMEVKSYLKENKISARWVAGREPVLSSVIVEQNKLIKSGQEFVLIEAEPNQYFLGETLAVQPFKALSFRDYGRPCRDDASGMLPPKLAQIMLNLALGAKNIKEQNILDPFCGSGTVLTEALLMGASSLIGSDISPKAIDDTSKNISWVQEKFKLAKNNLKLICAKAQDLSRSIKAESIDLIATEPYLGPQRGFLDLFRVVPDLEKLYSESLQGLAKMLKSGGRIAMIWPVFSDSKGRLVFLNPKINNFKMLKALPDQFLGHNFIQLSPRQNIIYQRPGQKVFREIVVLEKQKTSG